MKFGCCTNMTAHGPDGTGIEWVETLAEIGYDYIELPLTQMMELPEDQFQQLLDRVKASGIPCEVCNNFLPARIRLTGAETNDGNIADYVEKALSRAGLLGIKTIVFGSSGARNVPTGFPEDKAWQQLVAVLRYIDEMVEPYGITVAIEPLNKLESNIVNTTAAGLQLAREVDRKNIKLLVDYYHLMRELEDPKVLLEAGAWVQHVHFANPQERVFPQSVDEGDYATFFRNLKQIGYDGRISIEAYTDNFYDAAAKSLALVKRLAAAVASG